MKIIRLNNPARRFGISFDRMEQLLIKDDAVLHETIEANSSERFEKKTLVVELALARHANSYALLGAEFHPADTVQDANFVVEVKYNACKTNKYEKSLSIASTEIYCGLLKIYAEAILTGTKKYCMKNQVPRGKIVFNMGAHGEINSAPDIFSKVAQILLHILFSHSNEISEDKVKELCNLYL